MDDFFRQMAEKAGADMMVYGHTHKPYRKDLDGKIFINAGSVGKPKDGDVRSCVASVDIRPGIVETEFLRVPYDVGKMAWSIVDNGLPGYFAGKAARREIRSVMKKTKPAVQKASRRQRRTWSRIAVIQLKLHRGPSAICPSCGVAGGQVKADTVRSLMAGNTCRHNRRQLFFLQDG